MMKFCVAVISYQQKKLPLTDKVIISCYFLQYLNGLFPHAFTESKVPNVRDYWVLWQSDNKVDIFEEQSYTDNYQHSVFSLKTLFGEKYPLLAKVLWRDYCWTTKAMCRMREIICWMALLLIFEN